MGLKTPPGGMNKTAGPEVLAIGDVLMDYQYWVDRFPQRGGDVKILMSSCSPGGSAANTAFSLALLGIRCGFCGRIGKDAAGRRVEERMQNAGLDLSCMQYGDDTGYTVTIIDDRSERTMLSFRGAAGEPLELTAALRQTLQTVRVLLLSGYLLADAAQARFAVEAAGMTRRAGGLVALDASPNIENVPPDTLREALAVTDILLPNRREMQAITGVWETGAGLDALLRRVPIAALKLGAEGSALGIRGGYSETGRWHVPAVEVTPLDTTGAGDAFNAGFLASYLRGEKPEDWLRAGNALAARAISQKGAVPFDGMEEKVCAGVG